MKNSIKLLIFLLAFPAISLLESCHFDDDIVYPPGNSMDPNTYFGPSVKVGDGDAKAWVATDDKGNPIAVGINFSAKVLTNLPDSMNEFVLDLPDNKGKGFYTHATFGWNPHGHEPMGIYDRPHFDIHFYIISNEDRMKIGPNDTLQFAKDIDSIYVPDAYLHGPGGVPHMGAHWVDTMSPEFTGGEFTKTFIWGSYNGEFIFWEPMLTLDYLKTKPDEIIPLRQPDYFQRTGWYATKYKVSYSSSEDEYTVALKNLKYQKGK